MSVDPVCGNKGKAARRLRLRGRSYGFCSTACRERFRADPLAYLVDHP